jgi:hypothetical protein
MTPFATPEVFLTERRPQFARVIAAVVGFVSMHAAGFAWGQGAVRDQSGALTATPADEAKKSWLEQRFAGSFAEVTAYVGTSSFYSSGYRDPYISNAVYLRPQYQLGTKYKLTLAGRVYFEEEYTTPDTLNGRRFNPLDSYIYLTAKNLYTMPRAKVVFSGGARAGIPVSYESRYAHLVTTLGIALSASRAFEFGRPDAQGKRWGLSLTLGEGFAKALRTSAVRGNFPGDTSGCRTTGPAGFTGGPGAAESDRCGGPLSTSYSITSSGSVALSRSRYSLSVSLIVLNEVKYSIDADTYQKIVAMSDQVPTGRNDITWGIIAAGYDITEHLALGVGLASYQPALDSRYRYLRFPFFDFSGANANNFTQLFVGLTGTL